MTETSAREMIRWAKAKSCEEPRAVFVLGVELAGSAELVGIASLTVRDFALREADIGFILAREHWGKGYATEAVRTLLAKGFGPLNLHRIYGECDPANPGSARVMEKAGMRREGYMRESRRQKGQWVDRLLYAMIESDWPGGLSAGAAE